MANIMIAEVSPGWADIHLPFNRDINALMKALPGVRWQMARKKWQVPWHGIQALTDILTAEGHSVRIAATIPRPPANIAPAFTSVGAKSLRPYQLDAAERLARSFGYGYLLSFEQRVGKTPATTAAAASLLADGRAKTVIIAYPNSVKEEWVRQFKEWSGGLEVIPMTSKRPIDDDYLNWLAAQPWLVLGIHYELLGLGDWGDKIEKVLDRRGGRFVFIADEAQALKNRKAGRTKVALEMVRRADCGWRWALSGTPQRNYPRDLWALFEFIQPDSMGSYSKFGSRYCNTPDAPIWMGDFSFKPLGEVRVGDEVVGWGRFVGERAVVEPEGRDRLVRAQVTAVTRRENVPVVKVTMESGRTIRCTEDHLWLIHGYSDKPVGTGAWGHRKDRNVAIRADYAAGVGPTAIAEKYGVTPQQAWNIGVGYVAAFRPPAIGRKLVHVVETAEPNTVSPYLAGWVAGMYDGEGSGAFIAQSSVVNPGTWRQLDSALTALGIPHTMQVDTEASAGGARILGGRAGFLLFLRVCKPIRRSGWDEILLSGRFRNPDKIVSIVPDGTDTVIGLTTTTGNYVAWGYASKNCGAYQGAYGWVDSGVTNAPELAQRLAACSYRLLRSDVAKYLPKSDRKVVLCDMTGAAETAYRKQEAVLGPQAVAAMNESDDSRAIAALRQLSTLTAKSKLSTLIERIAEHTERGVKVLVFAQFHETLKLAIDAYETRMGPISFIAGGWLDSQKRKDAIDAWKAHAPPQHQNDPVVLFANTISSGVGIDLSQADVAIFLELTWVPADFQQAEARIVDVHQGTRTTPPLYEYLLVRGTVDEDMGIRLIDKIAAIEQVVGANTETSHFDDTIRASGLVEHSMLGLRNEDPDTVTAAMAALQKRLLGTDTPDGSEDSDNDLSEIDDGTDVTESDGIGKDLLDMDGNLGHLGGDDSE